MGGVSPIFRFDPRALHRPQPWFIVLLAMAVLCITLSLYPERVSSGERILGIYLTAVWSIPVGVALLVFLGSFRARAAMKALARRRRLGSAPFVGPEQLVIVQIPTVGRHDVMPALTRVVASFETFMPERFARWRLDVIAEKGCEAVETLEAMASDHVRTLYVPADYITPGGTERKARANHWINEVRIAQGEAGADVWILHMDDDTGIAGDTAREFARFIVDNPADMRSSLHLAQGVLTYPREFSGNIFAWLADSVRPSSDLSMFCMMTGSGMPLIGAHGELLLVRASVEARIGWDFGRLLSITEDANFALTFATHYPRKSGWVPARCYGSSPESVRDLVTQRKRWARGLLHVASNRRLPWSRRALLAYALTAWAVGPFQHVLVILGVAAALGMRSTVPLAPVILAIWAFNLGAGLWMYGSGLVANAHASGMHRPRSGHWAGLLLFPIFTLLEAWAGFLGVVNYVKDRLGLQRGELFEVISKTVPGGVLEQTRWERVSSPGSHLVAQQADNAVPDRSRAA